MWTVMSGRSESSPDVLLIQSSRVAISALYFGRIVPSFFNPPGAEFRYF